MFKNKIFKPFAIARDTSVFARRINSAPSEFNDERINTKIKEFWAKVRGVLGTVGILSVLTLVLRWAGVPTSVDGLQEVIGASDAVVEAITILIAAVSILIERASEAFKDE